MVFCKVPNTNTKSKNRSTPRDFVNQTWHLSRWTRQTKFFSENEFLAPRAVFFFPTILFSRAPISSPSPPISSPVLLRPRSSLGDRGQLGAGGACSSSPRTWCPRCRLQLRQTGLLCGLPRFVVRNCLCPSYYFYSVQCCEARSCPSVQRPMKEGRRMALNGQRSAWEGRRAALSSWRRSKRSVWRRRGRGRCKAAARSGEPKGPWQPICGAKKSPTAREYVAASRNPRIRRLPSQEKFGIFAKSPPPNANLPKMPNSNAKPLDPSFLVFWQILKCKTHLQTTLELL